MSLQNPPRRKGILIGVMVAMFTIAALWNANWMFRQRALAQRASVDLAESQQLAAAIASLREQPAVASDEVMGVQALGTKIVAASQRARLNIGEDDQAVSEFIYPQPPRRMGDSPYMIKPTALTLREISLEQLVTFLYHLTDEAGLSVRDLRLRTPHSATSEHLWDAEATLTYLIYTPPESRRNP